MILPTSCGKDNFFFVTYRIPCEEDHQKFYQDITRPSVKRHKLGTTTVTNQTSKNDEDIGKTFF